MSEPEAVTPVTVSIDDAVAVVRIDDGKANAVSHLVIDQIHEALDRASAEATAVAFVGREGRFSAGYDLSVMSAGIDATRALVRAGGELLMRVFTHPQPTVAAVTGHALAAGALLCLATDTRIGSADVPAKIGLNETAIGMAMPMYGVRLGEARLAERYLTRAIIEAEVFDMAGAIEAGYLDELVSADRVEAAAIDKARALGALDATAYGETKRRFRQAIADDVLTGLGADADTWSMPNV